MILLYNIGLYKNNMIPAFPELGIFFTLITLSLGIFVLYGSIIQKHIEKYVSYFVVSTIFSSIWLLINTVLLPLEVTDLNLLVGLSFSSSIIMILSIWRFAISFNKNKPDILTRLLDMVLVLLGTVFFVLSLCTPLIIESTIQTEEKLILEFGQLYSIFGIYFVLVFLVIAIKLIKQYRVSSGNIKSQLFYFVVGFYLTALISVVTNLLLPFYTGDSSSSRVGPFAFLFFLLFSSYAIARYQFLNIRVLVGRVVYYFAVAAIFWVTYYLIFYFDLYFFGGSTTIFGIGSGVLKAILFAALFIKFNEYLRVQVRSRIINPGYDPLEVIDRLSRNLAPLLNIKDIINEVITMVNSTIQPDNVKIILNTSRNSKKKSVEYTRKDDKGVLSPNKIEELYKFWGYIGVKTLSIQSLTDIEEKYFNSSKENSTLLEELLLSGIRVVVPIKQDSDHVGMLVLYKKQADSLYTPHDIEFLEGIATATGLAVTRATYYLEVQDLNKNLQKRVDEATEELQNKNKTLEDTLEKIEEIRRQERDMIDVMGHELRTPITIVRNALLVLESKLKKKEELPHKKLMDYIDKAIESSRREVNLVETLLSATKVESNRIQLNLTEVDVKDVVNDSIEALKGYAKDKDIKIEFDEPKKNYFAYADRTRIQEVMDNLLSNAIKYTVHGDVSIKITSDEKYASVSVKDTGIGIAKDDIKHLGKKFFRAKQYLKKNDGGTNGVVRPGGTGLGLYVSFNLVRLMKGKIDIDSELGKGSIFTFKIPVFKGQEDKHIDQTFIE